MEATQAFDGDDCSGRQEPSRQLQRLLPRVTSWLEPDMWTARGAGHRLGVEAAVERIAVFAGARRTHHEGCHGRGRAVIRNVFDDRKARAAVRAVNEGIAEPTVLGIEQLPQAVGADADVRRDGLDTLLASVGAEDFKVGEAIGWD